MPALIPSFLAAAELAELRALAGHDGWTPGRQGTGYEILPLRPLAPHAVLEAAFARALDRIGAPWQDHWDSYLIRYRDGSHIPPHRDPAAPETRHRRLNARIEPCAAGGELWVDGTRVELALGDAVLFEPDRELHEVTRVTGTRMLFSVGAWVAR